MMQLLAQIRKDNIIQIYALTGEKSDDKIQIFFEGVEIVLESMTTHDLTIIIADFKPKIGGESRGI